MRICGVPPGLEITTKQSQEDAFTDTEPRQTPIPGPEVPVPDVHRPPGQYPRNATAQVTKICGQFDSGWGVDMMVPELPSHDGSLGLRASRVG